MVGCPHTRLPHIPHTPTAGRQTHSQAPQDTYTAAQACSALPARCCPSDSTRSARHSPSSSATHRLNTDTANCTRIPVRCLQASNPPHSSNSRRSSVGYTPASAHRHTRYDTHTDTPARSAHPAATHAHHRYYTRTHTLPARRSTRNRARSSPTDPPHHTRTHAHTRSAHYSPNAPRCPLGSTQSYTPHPSTHPAPTPTDPTQGHTHTHPSAPRSAHRPASPSPDCRPDCTRSTDCTIPDPHALRSPTDPPACRCRP
jgi:hypothetical protein